MALSFSTWFGVYLKRTSPLLSSNSHGSIIIASPSRSQRPRRFLPGTLQFLVLPSMQETFILLAPSLCEIIPITSLPFGSRTLTGPSYGVDGVVGAEFFLDLSLNLLNAI